MFKKILVPTDGSPLSIKAIKAAVEFAKEIHAQIYAISVAEPYPYIPAVAGGIAMDPNYYDEDVMRLHDKQAHKLAQDHVQQVVDIARTMDVPCTITTALSYNPYEEIVKAIDKFGCDVIFMASHGRKGFSKLFLGSETQKVLANSLVPVIVFR